MLNFFYAPGACSLASHIALEESGATYEATPILLAKGEHRTESYLKVNPRGKVPALAIDGEVLTENTAILTYVAKSFPEAKLMPADRLGTARCISAMAYFSNSVHPAFTHIMRPERFSADDASHAAIKAAGRNNFFAYCREIDALLQGKEWLIDGQFTVCDGYALVFYAWGSRIELPMTELAAYTAFKKRMLARPAVRRILERENSPLLAA